mmetsp:Transcript_5718/g.10251  ORF Transcript_5718/g.10251 Transcript_5718/m.10251 type:complete len:838 (+) Transcript_5718:74-2587(+)
MSSRILVKGLPKYVDSTRLRDTFSSIGDVTDAKVMKTKDGASRQFGFVGFVDEKHALAAKKRFHGTYLDTSRLTVEIAKAIGDQTLEKPWSKYSKESKSRERKEKEKETKKKKSQDTKLIAKSNEKDSTKESSIEAKTSGKRPPSTGADAPDAKKAKVRNEDQEFDAFLQVIQPRTKQPLWQDTGMTLNRQENDEEDDKPQRKHTKQEIKNDSDSDSVGSNVEQEELEPTNQKKIYVSDLDFFKAKTVHAKMLDDDVYDDQEAIKSMKKSEPVTENGPPSAANIKPKLAKEIASATSNDRQPEKSVEEEEKQPVYHNKSENDNDNDNLQDTGRLFIRNLPYKATEEDLEVVLNKFGPLAEIHLVIDRVTKQSKGYAYALFVDPNHAARARTSLDGTIFQGRLLHVLPAKLKPGEELSNGHNDTGTTFKAEREQKRKESAKSGSDTQAWGTLFMNHDAVASVIATRLNMSKSEIYGIGSGESGAAAVRLAAAEAQLQNEAREALNMIGIDAAALFEAKKTAKLRSRRSILVKNLPAGATEKDLEELFGPSGTLSNIMVIGGGLIGLVEFAESQDAKIAYKKLAYRRFQKGPILYLEWAPLKNEEPTSGSKVRSSSEPFKENEHSVSVPNKPTEPKQPVFNAAANVVEVAPPCSVFVKNLNFSTTEETLRNKFSEFGSLRSVKIARKKQADSDALLSMGYGFVEYNSEQDAKEAISRLNGALIDGHAVELKVSHRGRDAEVAGGDASKKRKKGSKIIVRNLAFEATNQDVRALFTAFGPVKAVRVPRKMDGSHRGYAFIEFFSEQEATAALQSLSAAHLYGRHLVMEFAENESELDQQA